jgi:hypothetical protein
MKIWKYGTIVYAFVTGVQLFGASPCDDAQYLELKTRHVDSMSKREYDYFMLKERYCNELTLASAKEQYAQRKNVLIGVRIEGTKNERLDDAPDLNRVRRYWEDRLAIYLDEVKYTNLVFACSPGLHTISLFSEGTIEEEHGDLRAHMKQSRLTIDAEPDRLYLITFSFHCQSYEKTCGEDYWYFDISCRDVQEKSELEKLAKHVPVTKASGKKIQTHDQKIK